MSNCDLLLGWAFNPYYSGYLKAQGAEKAKPRGMKGHCGGSEDHTYYRENV